MNENNEILDAYVPRQEREPLTYFMVLFRPMCIGAGLFLMGALFKLQSWPYASQLLMASVVLFSIGACLSLAWHFNHYKAFSIGLTLQVLGTITLAFNFLLITFNTGNSGLLNILGGIGIALGSFLYSRNPIE